MSGMFGNVAQIAVPDFGQTLARAQGMQANRLAMLAQQRQMDQQDQMREFFAQNGAGFASADPSKRMNLLSMLAAQGGQGAAMALPMLDQERRRAELRDIMGDGATPAAPVMQPAGGSYVDRMVSMESGGDPNARNPRSSATGAGQFIDSTWLQFAAANPQRFQGMSREQILAARSDPNLSREAVDWYRRENMAALSGQGLPANDGTAALAHRFGPGDAARLLRADPNAPIASVVSPQVMTANPDLAGRTVGQVVQGYGRRFSGGDAIPAQAGAGTPTTGAGADQRIAILQRRAERLTAAGYQQEAQNTLALIQSLRRGESEPLERVRRPDGVEVLVPRSQAAGMESAPNPREQPGPFGSGERGRSLQAIEELAPVIAQGNATPEQLRRYSSAVTNYQQEETRPDGARVTPRLPPYAPGLDWVSQRYPGAQFAAAPQPGGATPAQAGAPASAPVAAGDAVPAAPNLPPAGSAPTLPGAQGGVTRDGNAMEAGTRRQIEEQIVANQDAISRIAGIRQGFRPEYQTLGTRWSNMWNSFREMGTGRLGTQEQQRLREYTQYRAASLENLNRTIQETTGAAMGAEEARRITATMPNPGTGLFDGDSPTEFQAKVDRATDMLRSALIRRHYALTRGLNPTQTGIELSDVPRLYMRRAGEIEREIRQDNSGISAEELGQRTRARLRQEFGV